MKLHTEDQTPVLSSGNIKRQTFKIAASAKAFKILSSNLYKDKRLAVVREISCNAVDAHIAAEKAGMNPPAEFDVHLPTVFDKTFRVRDYGIGLSQDDIFNLYTTYFASTKSDSDDYIGALGLGSKSPFSYTDTFMITSWHGGTKTVYSAFLADGEPDIALMHQEPSTEPNGVEISVPTGQDPDIWAQCAMRVYSTFETYRPKMIGNDISIKYMDFDDRGIAMLDSDWRMGRERMAYAVMGGVVYPLPREKYEGSLFWRKHNNGAVYIKFGVGELDIAPSREELSLDDLTLQNIDAKIQQLGKCFQDEIDAILKSTDDIRELYDLVSGSEYAFIWGTTMLDNHVVQGKTVKEWRNMLRDGYRGLSAPKSKQLPYYRMVNGELTRGVHKRGSYNTPKFGGVQLTSNGSLITGSKPPVVVFCDVKTAGTDILYGMYKLGMIPDNEPVLYVDKYLKTRDRHDGTLNRIDHREDVWAILKRWKHKYKVGRVFVLSKVKDSVQAQMKAKNIQRTAPSPSSKSAGPRLQYWKIDPVAGRASVVSLNSDDIAKLDNPLYVIKHVDDYCKFDMIKETKTYKKKAPVVVDVPGSKPLFSTREVSVFAKLAWYTKRDIYVCRKSEARHFINNPTSVCAVSELVKWVSSSVDSLTEDSVVAPNTPRWASRLKERQELMPIYYKITCKSGDSKFYNDLSDVMSSCRFYTDAERKEFDRCYTVMNKLVSTVSDAAKMRYDDFKELNPLLVDYLECRYYYSDEIAKQILEFVKYP